MGILEEGTTSGGCSRERDAASLSGSLLLPKQENPSFDVSQFQAPPS